MRGISKRLAVVGLVGALTVLGTGVAVAGVSSGNYEPSRQHCTGDANDFSHDESVEPGCRNLIGSLSDGNGNGEVNVGTQQTPDGTQVDPTQPLVDSDPSGFDPTTGARLYFGADDNLDTGEHDSSPKMGDGPSDGGAIALDILPATLADWAARVQSDGIGYLLTHPLPILAAGAGSCADGICESVQTQQREVFAGGNPDVAPRDAANYDGHRWDPETCAGPSDGTDYATNTETTDCNDPNDPNTHHDITYWAQQNGSVYAEPGVQIYEDPNPEGSPIGPYPLPAVYVGTCGVVLGGGDLQMPASPVTNGAGQVVLKTLC